MNPSRVSAKIFVDDDASVNEAALIPIFHRWIREKVVDGMLIDVADYIHVPHGPGVMLIGHEGDYALDMASRPGMKYMMKRDSSGDFATDLRLVFTRVFSACQRLAEEDNMQGISFNVCNVRIKVHDRLAAPNSSETYAILSELAGPLIREIFGADVKVLRGSEDPRDCIAICIEAASADIEQISNRLAVPATS